MEKDIRIIVTTNEPLVCDELYEAVTRILGDTVNIEKCLMDNLPDDRDVDLFVCVMGRLHQMPMRIPQEKIVGLDLMPDNHFYLEIANIPSGENVYVLSNGSKYAVKAVRSLVNEGLDHVNYKFIFTEEMSNGQIIRHLENAKYIIGVKTTLDVKGVLYPVWGQYFRPDAKIIGAHRSPTLESACELMRWVTSYRHSRLLTHVTDKTNHLAQNLRVPIRIQRKASMPLIPSGIMQEQTGEGGSVGSQDTAFLAAPQEYRQLYSKFNDLLETIKKQMEKLRDNEAALSISEEKFYKAFRFAAEIIAIVRLSDSKYLEANNAFYRILGYKREAVIGHSVKEFGLWKHPREYQQVLAVLEEQGSFRNQEVSWVTQKGNVRIGVCSGEIIKIGAERCVLLVWYDVTERKQMEEQLRQAHDELEAKVELRTQELTALNQELRVTNEELANALERAQKMQTQLVQAEKMASLGALVAGVAHEVNTPLGNSITVGSHLQALTKAFIKRYIQGREGMVPLKKHFEEEMECLDMLMSNLQRAAVLIRSFKHVAADQMAEKRMRFYIKKYLEEILITLRPSLRKTKLQVEVDCPADFELNSYPGVFAQIVSNLVMNSIIHAYSGESEGCLQFHIRQEEDTLLFIYRDDGRGMDEGVCKRIFDPFFTTRRGSGGTGLGLSIVYNLVTKTLCGTIECESVPGKGTAFVIQVPLVTKVQEDE